MGCLAAERGNFPSPLRKRRVLLCRAARRV
jgi:hypothetical protein